MTATPRNFIITADSIVTLNSLFSSGQPAPINNQVVRVLGYFAAYDCGEPWEMIYHSTGRPTPDGGFYINGPKADDYWEAIDKSVANVKRFGATGDGATNDHAALQAAVNAMVAGTSSEVVLAAGNYVIAEPITFTPTDSSHQFRMRGIGHFNDTRTLISAAASFTGDALLKSVGHTTNGVDNSAGKWEGGQITDLQFSAFSAGGTLDYCIDMGACSHMRFERIRTLYGDIAGLRMGYNFTNRFNNCLFQSANIGVFCDNGVNNNITFTNTGFLGNSIGYLCNAGIELNFYGCGVEQNDITGLWLNSVRGGNVESYFEENGDTGHTFTQDTAGSALADGPWLINADVIVSTTGITGSTLPIRIQDLALGQNMTFTGCSTGRATDGVFVAIVSGDEVTINKPAFLSTLPSTFSIAEVYGAYNTVGAITINGIDNESVITPSNAMRYVSDGMTGANGTLKGLSLSKFSWATDRQITILPESLSDTGNGDLVSENRQIDGQEIYSIGGHTATTGYFTRTISLIDYPELVGKRLVAEVEYWALSTEYTVTPTFTATGIEITVDGEATASSIEAKRHYAETTGTTSGLTLTVADATEFQPGRWVVIDGAGPNGGPHGTWINAVSGTTITIAEAGASDITGENIYLPQLMRLTKVFQQNGTDNSLTFSIRQINSGGTADSRTAIKNIRIRELGSTANDVQEASLNKVFYASENNVSGFGDQRANIQSLIDTAGDYSHIVMDVPCEISDDLVPREGQTIEWTETTTLNDSGAVTRMVSCAKPNITLINPLLDMNHEGNTNNTVQGTQAVISNYGTGSNLRIIGGLLENGIDNGFQGGRDGLVIDGTEIRNCGEHAVYVNGEDANGSGLHANGLTFRNMRIDGVGVSQFNYDQTNGVSNGTTLFTSASFVLPTGHTLADYAGGSLYIDNGTDAGYHTISGTPVDNAGTLEITLTGALTGSETSLIFQMQSDSYVGGAEAFRSRNANGMRVENPVIHLGNPQVPSYFSNPDNIKGYTWTGGYGDGCNHTGFWPSATAENVTITGFQGEHIPITGGISTTFRSNGKNMILENCKFTNFGGCVEPPDFARNCEWVDIPIEFRIDNPGTFENCSFTAQAGFTPSSLIRMEGGGVSLRDCTINGDQTIGIWVRNFATGSTIIDGCNFPDHTGNRAVYIEGGTGESHVVTNNSVPLSTSASAIQFGSYGDYQGTHDIEGNTFGTGGSITSGAFNRFKKVTPEMFGAVGDGTTNDAAAFTAAAAIGSATVLLSDNKTYRIASDIIISTDIEFIGLGRGSRILCDNDGTTFLFNGNTIVKNITFDANDSNLVERMLHVGGTSSQLLVEDCRFVNMLSDTYAQGLTLSGDIESVLVSRCTFKAIRAFENGIIGDPNGGVRGIYASSYGDQLTIRDCHFLDINNRDVGNTKNTYEDADGIQVQNLGNDLFFALIDNCYFEDCGKRGIKLESEGQINVTNCRCVSSWGRSSKVNPTVDFVDSNPDTITRGSGSWITDGFEPGQWINVHEANISGNNGSYLITGVTATTLTLDASEAVTADTGDTTATLEGINGMLYFISCSSGDCYIDNCNFTGGASTSLAAAAGATTDLMVVTNSTYKPDNKDIFLRGSNTQFLISTGPELVIKNCRSENTNGVINATSGDRWTCKDGYHKCINNAFFVLAGDEGLLENCTIEEDSTSLSTGNYVAFAADNAKQLVVKNCRSIGTFRDGINIATQAGTGLLVIAEGNDFSSVSTLEVRGSTYQKFRDRDNSWNIYYATTTELEDNSAAVNTVIGKREGKEVWNTTTGRPVWAAGDAAGDVWVDNTGSTIHTPV